MRVFKILFLVSAAVVLSGCAMSSKHKNTIAGTVLGGAAATIGGVNPAAGAAGGGALGYLLTEEDPDPCRYSSSTRDPNFTGGAYNPTQGSASVNCSIGGSPENPPKFHVPSDVQ